MGGEGNHVFGIGPEEEEGLPNWDNLTEEEQERLIRELAERYYAEPEGWEDR